MDETEPKSQPPKVFDIANPRRVQPSTNSRPVIITNRPMIARDPMMKASVPTIKDVPAPSERHHTVIHLQPSEPVTDPKAEKQAENPALLDDTISEDTPVSNPYTTEAVAPNAESASVGGNVTGSPTEDEISDEAILKEIVDKHEYFVQEHDVHTVNRRTINPLVWIILGSVIVIVLIILDLLIDSNIISIGPLQSLPHTNFFTHN